MFHTLADCFSQWLSQGHCESLPRVTAAHRALATRARRLEGSPGFSGILGAAKALPREFLAAEALAEAQWLRDLGIHWRLDYGRRPSHTSGLASCSTFAGLRNLGNSCYLNSRARPTARRCFRAVTTQRAVGIPHAVSFSAAFWGGWTMGQCLARSAAAPGVSYRRRCVSARRVCRCSGVLQHAAQLLLDAPGFVYGAC